MWLPVHNSFTRNDTAHSIQSGLYNNVRIMAGGSGSIPYASWPPAYGGGPRASNPWMSAAQATPAGCIEKQNCEFMGLCLLAAHMNYCREPCSVAIFLIPSSLQVHCLQWARRAGTLRRLWQLQVSAPQLEFSTQLLVANVLKVRSSPISICVQMSPQAYTYALRGKLIALRVHGEHDSCGMQRFEFSEHSMVECAVIWTADSPFC